MNTYRVWMKDGYAGIYNGDTEEEAKRQAVTQATISLESGNWTQDSYDRYQGRGAWKKATTVDYAEKLNP